MVRRFFAAAAVAGLALASLTPSGASHSRFPSANPNPRIGTPDDPDYDCAEPDDEDAVKKCSSVWSEQWKLFGFAPAATRGTALYHDAAHLAAQEFSQRSGVSVDRAWKKTIGDPRVSIAIIDTGILWDRSELRLRVRLNRAELPVPPGPCLLPWPDPYDCNGDGVFNVADYDNETLAVKNAGPNGMTNVIDGQDLINTYSNLTDDDGNGYVDDIAGWDFFDDDNDPYDASSYSSAGNHGSGRAADALQETNNGTSSAGICPRCQLMPLRAWDTFVVPGDNYAMATLYAADNGASVQEIALGVLQNSRFAQAATQYAFHKGVALMQVSSDLNTSDHNYPTNYNNTVFVAGSVADTHGLGQNNEQLAPYLRTFGIGTNGPVGTWFRNSNITQFGGHAAIVMMGDTGSQATGQAAGAAGLVKSMGLQVFGAPGLSSNEVKQILTATAEDVLPENTLGLGTPDPAQPGWDQHFGYGRADLGAAVARVTATTIPPEAGIESPAWFAPLDPVATPTVPVTGFTAASRAATCTYQLAYAVGLEPLASAFTPIGTPAPCPAGANVSLGTLPLATIAAAMPGSASGVPPTDPYQYVFTVRLRATDNLGNVGEDRKTLFAYHDPTVHAGWPKFVDTGGDSSIRFANLDSDAAEEIVTANSSGELAVWKGDGSALSTFNGGVPLLAPVPTFIANHITAPAFTTGGVSPGRGGFTTPAIGDIDGGGADIVVVNGEKVYALHADGTPVAGYPVSIDPAFSAPAVRSRTNHVKTGIFSSPVLADLDADGSLDVIAAALDERVYAWNGTGATLAGWPVFVRDPASGACSAAAPCAEIINTPAVADINGDNYLDVVLPTNEYVKAVPPASPADLADALRKGFLDLASGVAGLVSSRVYAIQHDGTVNTGGPFLPGWPAKINGVADILPLIGPGFDPVIVDVDGGPPEVVIGAPLGEMVVFGGDGKAKFNLRSNATPGRNANPGTILNLFEYPAVGDLSGAGRPGIFKGGLPIEGLVNLVAAGQNLPFTHVVQGWDAQTGQPLPGWPLATDDWQLLSSPSIANVGGDAAREVIVGTGLYLLHAYGPAGTEPAGFPKFTGGWLFGVTPVGDIDGDGYLNIANWTREGNVFVWDTDVPATPGNIEWGGFRHDNRNSGVYP
jgi:hypothetical protein